MDQLIPFVQSMIDKFGLVAVLAAFGAVNYLLIARSSRKAEDAASAAESARQDANTRQQDAVTAQFTLLSEENRRLAARVNTLEDAQVALIAANAAQDKELKATQQIAERAQAAQKASDERANALAKELENLRVKVMTLETERAVRLDELKRETERSAKLEREVTDLRSRVARLEGENSALRQVLDKLNVVSVKPPPNDDPPPTPPTSMHLVPKDGEAA